MNVVQNKYAMHMKLAEHWEQLKKKFKGSGQD